MVLKGMGWGGGVRGERGWKYRSDTRVVGQHQSAHTVAHGDIRTPLREGNLDARRSPRYKRSQPPLADTQQTLVHIRRVDLTLYDIEDGNIAALLARYGRHHAVLWLQQPPHDVQHRRLAHRLGLLDLVAREGCVGRHEEVAAGSGYQGG